MALVLGVLKGPGEVIRLKLLSKFGKFGEYEHFDDDVPTGYRYDRFVVMTERVEP